MAKAFTKEYFQSLTEDKLRTEIVIPLFRAMGFTVHETHGALEFGKDLVVYSRDNTGEIVYSAVQIKTKDIHGSTSRPANIRTVIQQCESAFQVPFSDAFGPAQRHIEKVYVVTSGQITPAAETIILNSLRNYGPVRFMDVTRLVAQAAKMLSTEATEADEQKETTEQKHTTKQESSPRSTWSTTRKIITGCGALYVTYSKELKENPFVIVHLGKAGGCASAQLEALGYLVGLALQRGATVREVVEKLRGIRCPSIAWEEGQAVLSCPDAIAMVLENAADKK